MKTRSIVLTDEAVNDIDRAVGFYNRQVEGLGQYFFDSVVADIEALRFYGGIHERRFGYFCCSVKRFPFLIYYSLGDTVVTIVAVLDTRRSPGRTNKRLS